MGLYKGRPTLDVILQRANASNGARFITRRIQRVSTLLQILEFDNSTIPNGRSGRLVFNYERGEVARVAQLRAYYTDYQAQFANLVKTPASAILRPMGDAFEIDRVLGRADSDYVQEQIDGMAPGISNLFTDLMINGDDASNPLEFAGLSKILTGTAQEIDGTGMDFSANAPVAAGGDPFKAQREMLGSMRREVSKIRGLGLTPVWIANDDARFRIEMLGEQMGFASRTPDMFGENQISTLSGTPIVDSGLVNRKTGPADVSTGLYPTATAEVIPTVGGKTDIYLVGISRVNGFCGVTIDSRGGTDPVYYKTANDDAGVLRRFEAELVAGVALLDERAATVFRGVKVA
jgi:hypothetical protein